MIAADGFPIEPIVVDSVFTAPGERFDFVIDATNDQHFGNFWFESIDLRVFFAK